MLVRDENGRLNPIEEINGLWYFWNEAWAHSHGPYKDKQTAELAMEAYCQTLDGPIEP